MAITLEKEEPVVASTDNKVSMAVANELPSAADLHYYWKDGSASKLLVRIKPGKTKTKEEEEEVATAFANSKLSFVEIRCFGVCVSLFE